jgi:hypothetical protein
MRLAVCYGAGCGGMQGDALWIRRRLGFGATAIASFVAADGVPPSPQVQLQPAPVVVFVRRLSAAPSLAQRRHLLRRASRTINTKQPPRRQRTIQSSLAALPSSLPCSSLSLFFFLCLSLSLSFSFSLSLALSLALKPAAWPVLESSDGGAPATPLAQQGTAVSRLTAAGSSHWTPSQ